MRTNLKTYADQIKNRLAFKNVTDFELFIEAKEGQSLEVKNGEREFFEIKKGLGFSIRIMKDRRMTFSYGNDFSDDGIDSVIDTCLESIPYMDEDEANSFPQPKPLPEIPDLVDSRFFDYTFEDKFNFLVGMEKAAHEFDPRIKDVQGATLDDEWETIWIENSNGLCATQEKSVFCVSLGVQAKDGTEEEIAYEMDSKVYFEELDGPKMARLAAEHALQLLHGEADKNYKGKVILHRDVVCELLEVWVPSFLGESIEKDNSYHVGKLGKKLYSNLVTLVDDGRMPGVPTSANFDGEGCPLQVTTLVESGKLKAFLYDTYWAARTGQKSTSNSVRADFTDRPDLAYHHLRLLPGKQSFEDLVKEMKDGIVILDMIGLHNADEVSGAFSAGIQGYRVKDGKPEKAIRSMLYTAKVPDLFKAVLNVANDEAHIGGVSCCSLLIDKAQLSGTS